MAVRTGTDGSDTLVGTPENDTITGFAGDDTLRGLGGDDWLDGGSGTDTVEGGTGNDTYVVDFYPTADGYQGDALILGASIMRVIGDSGSYEGYDYPDRRIYVALGEDEDGNGIEDDSFLPYRYLVSRNAFMS